MTLRTVLLVDDDSALRQRLAEALRRRGLDVIEAGSVPEALVASAKAELDGAVVDLRMPGGTGLDVVAHLRAKHPCSRLILQTGYGSIATALQAVRQGADDYLLKPADADQILKALHGEPAAHEHVPEGGPPSLHRVEWEHIQRVLAENNNNISQAARILGLDRRSLQRKLAKFPPPR